MFCFVAFVIIVTFSFVVLFICQGPLIYLILGGCPYNKAAPVEALRDEAILAVHDIEDLIAAGKKTNSCPYYASRYRMFRKKGVFLAEVSVFCCLSLASTELLVVQNLVSK